MKKFALVLALALAMLLALPAFAAENVIPFPESYDTTSSGASSYENCGDHADSLYFAHPDYYNMTSTDTLTILTGFKTYQQTTEYTCGPASALMVLYYFGEEGYDEMTVAEAANCLPGEGTTPQGLTDFFTGIGWEVTNNLSDGSENGEEEFDPDTFKAWVLEKLTAGTPVIVDGIRTRLVGRVSMDMITVDLTPVANAHVGSEVTLWGNDLPIDEVAEAAGTVGYELMCALSLRPRIVECW